MPSNHGWTGGSLDHYSNMCNCITYNYCEYSTTQDTPRLGKIAQCTAYTVWLLAKIIMEIMSDTHSVDVVLLFAVHGFSLPHRPGWNSGSICVGTQRILILCIMTWHTVGTIIPITKIIMQAVQDTLELMSPNKINCRRPMQSPPKFRNGRYWRRIHYPKRRFQNQPLYKLMTLLVLIHRKLYRLHVYLHTNCYMQHIYTMDTMMQTQSVCTITHLYMRKQLTRQQHLPDASCLKSGMQRINHDAIQHSATNRGRLQAKEGRA